MMRGSGNLHPLTKFLHSGYVNRFRFQCQVDFFCGLIQQPVVCMDEIWTDNTVKLVDKHFSIENEAVSFICAVLSKFSVEIGDGEKDVLAIASKPIGSETVSGVPRTYADGCGV